MSQASLPTCRKQAQRPTFRVTELAAACAMAMAGASGALAQQAPAAAVSQPEATQTIVVKGIRSSLASSLELKRDGQGVVDGISAEDIGKFPDTNLAESLQRISGVSIDRSIGEGSRVTVRGVGPEFNAVLLNGRQMPASSIADTGASNSRAFDFGNLASEAIAGIEVYKTSRASSPTGGIGATINIKTARPLDNPGLRGSFGIKGVVDTSNSRLPSTMAGSEVTPEVSGIYSNTFADGRFGVALSASYQERDLGYNQAAVGGGWIVSRGNAGALANPNTANPADITNKPKADDLYSLPQNLIYSVNGVQRQRTNGQLTLQFAPTNNVRATLDYTYSELKLQTKRNELSAWFNFGSSSSSWTDGPIASPKFYSETLGPGSSPLRRPLADVAMAGSDYATKNENKSTGLNVTWKVSDRLKLEFDAHSSTAESGADSPYGSNNSLGTASFNRGTTSVDFTRDFPVLSIHDSDINPALMKVTGSSFRNSYMKSGVDQAQLKGQFKPADDSKLDFGLSLNRVKNRSAFSNVQQDDWGGGQSDVATFPDRIWRADQIRPYFGQISGSGSPALYNQFFTWDFATVRNLAAAARGDQAMFLPSSTFTTDRRVEEKSQSAFLQYTKDWDTAMPMRAAIGVRYEETDVTAQALVPVAVGINWTAANEYPVQFAGSPGFTTLTGNYKHLLPSLDFDVDVTDRLKARASYGESIGRPGWGDIQGGQTLNALARVDGGTGQQGIDRDPIGAELPRQRAGHAHQRRFGGGVVQVIGTAHQKCGRRHIDHSAPLVAAHQRHQSPGHQESACNVDIEHPHPFVHRNLLEGLHGDGGKNRSVVDQHIATPKFLLNGCSGPLHAADIGHINRQSKTSGAQGPELQGHTFERLGLQIKDHHAVALFGKPDGVGASQALRRACDHDHPAGRAAH